MGINLPHIIVFGSGGIRKFIENNIENARKLQDLAEISSLLKISNENTIAGIFVNCQPSWEAVKEGKLRISHLQSRIFLNVFERVIDKKQFNESSFIKLIEKFEEYTRISGSEFSICVFVLNDNSNLKVGINGEEIIAVIYFKDGKKVVINDYIEIRDFLGFSILFIDQRNEKVMNQELGFLEEYLNSDEAKILIHVSRKTVLDESHEV